MQREVKRRNELMSSFPKLFDKLNIHMNAYESIGLRPPPYRITRSELKKVWPSLKPLCKEIADNTHYDDIRYLMGIELEIVTIG